MGWFYNKEIEIYTYTSAKDANGTNRKGWIKSTTVPNQFLVDVQPYSYEKAVRDYGYKVECTKRIFMDIIPEAVESSAIKYRDQFYKIQKIIDWDDYLEILCLERDDIKANG